MGLMRIIQQAPDGSLQPANLLGDTSVPRKFFADMSHDPSTIGGVTLAAGDKWEQSLVTAASIRPSGAGYVTYESLYVGGDTLQQTLNRCTGNNTVTFPEGLFQFSNFANGFIDGIRIGSGGATACGGIAGSGRNTIFQMTPGSSTHAADGNVTTGTNNCYLLNFAGVSGTPMTKCELRNFTLLGSNQGHYYNGIMIQWANNAIVDGLYLLGASPGFSNFPPGETFGINPLHTDNCTIQNSEVDGRSYDGSGTRICASPIGWNNSTNAHINNTYTHHSLASSVTFWMTVNVTTNGMRNEFNGSGSGTVSGEGVNHERVTGTVSHTNPQFIIDRAHGNTGLHISINNDQANDPNVTVTEPTFDPGPGTGCFSVEIDDAYSTGNLQTSLPTVILNGRTLIGLDGNTGGASTGNPAINFVRYH